jgi:hypothetical protein
MIAEPNLPLREVAKRLAQIRGLPKGKTAVSALLGLLKTGELKAGFEFPGTSVLWISIPTSYWTAVSSNMFRSLQYVAGDKRRTGTYEVRISEFADEYMQAVSQQMAETTSTSMLNEFKKALSAAQQRYEVGITAQEWMNYLERHQIREPAVQKRSSGGRHPKTSWHHLTPIIAAYMMTLDKRPSESLDHDSIAKMILQLAKEEDIPDLPAPDTLSDVIAKIFSRVKRLSNS